MPCQLYSVNFVWCCYHNGSKLKQYDCTGIRFDRPVSKTLAALLVVGTHTQMFKFKKANALQCCPQTDVSPNILDHLTVSVSYGTGDP